MSAKACQGGASWWSARMPAASIVPENSIIVGNTVLYGATDGETYFRGVAGERFGVRNSGGRLGCRGHWRSLPRVHDGRRRSWCSARPGATLAAGMSGGIAYVYDPDGTLESRTNMAMVELEPITDDETEHEAIYHQTREAFAQGKMKIVGDLTKFDAARLRHLVEKHVAYTGSGLAQGLLDDWREAQGKFKKVMPVEYRQAMEKLATTEAQVLETVGA